MKCSIFVFVVEAILLFGKYSRNFLGRCQIRRKITIDYLDNILIDFDLRKFLIQLKFRSKVQDWIRRKKLKEFWKVWLKLSWIPNEIIYRNIITLLILISTRLCSDFHCIWINFAPKIKIKIQKRLLNSQKFVTTPLNRFLIVYIPPFSFFFLKHFQTEIWISRHVVIYFTTIFHFNVDCIWKCCYKFDSNTHNIFDFWEILKSHDEK